jgi:uncharacterized protein YggE
MVSMNFARLAVVVSAIGLTPLGAQDPGRPQQPQIVVNASGEVRVAPDRATIQVGVQSRATTAAEAAAQNSRKQRAVIDAIRARGIPAEQIGTLGFNVVPETRYDREGQQAPRTTSYLVSNVVSVDVRKIDLVGPVIDAALAAGANQINSLSFGISSADSARRAALASAVSKARADAEVMARAAGGTLGPLIELHAMEAYVPSPRAVALESLKVTAAADAVPIEAGQETVRATVMARWQFMQGPPR